MKNRILGSMLCLMVAVPSTAFAQTDIKNQSDATPVIAGVQELKGVVVDENKAPIGFANVVLLKADSTYLAGTVTDQNGFFVFRENQDSSRFIKISSIGYASRTIDLPLTGDFGIITLDTENAI